MHLHQYHNLEIITTCLSHSFSSVTSSSQGRWLDGIKIFLQEDVLTFLNPILHFRLTPMVALNTEFSWAIFISRGL